MNIKEKFSNFFESAGFWFTNGEVKGSSTGRLILLGLTIITPIFLIMSAPWLAWISIAPEHRYDLQYNWLQDFMWIWPVVLFGIGFLSLLSYMIYMSITNR